MDRLDRKEHGRDYCLLKVEVLAGAIYDTKYPSE
jgi:hypothetical protein